MSVSKAYKAAQKLRMSRQEDFVNPYRDQNLFVSSYQEIKCQCGITFMSHVKYSVKKYCSRVCSYKYRRSMPVNIVVTR